MISYEEFIPVDGTPKAPHIRSGHPRKFASGIIIFVKEAKVHKEMM